MGRRFLIVILCIFLFTGRSFSGDLDATAKDLKGIPKSHKYLWSIVGGTALGAGLGVIAPGGTKSAFKGALLGGSVTSAFYLAKHPRALTGWREWAHVGTNAALGTGILWTFCDCNEGALAGGLLGGGGTAVYQALASRSSKMASFTGTSVQPQPGSQTIASFQLQDPNSTNPDKRKSGKETPRQEPREPRLQQQP
jgi:hypothetical protein